MLGLVYKENVRAWWHEATGQFYTSVTESLAKLLGFNFELYKLEVNAAYGPGSALKIDYLQNVKLEDFVGAQSKYIVSEFRKLHNRAVRLGKEENSNWTMQEAELFSELSRKIACPIAYIYNNLISPTRLASRYSHNLLKAYLSDLEVLNKLSRKMHLSTWYSFPPCVHWIRNLGRMQLVKYDDNNAKFVHIGTVQRHTGIYTAPKADAFKVELFDISKPKVDFKLPEKLPLKLIKRFKELGDVFGLKFDKAELINPNAHEVYQILAYEFKLYVVAQEVYENAIKYVDQAIDVSLDLYLEAQAKRLKPKIA